MLGTSGLNDGFSRKAFPLDSGPRRGILANITPPCHHGRLKRSTRRGAGHGREGEEVGDADDPQHLAF